MPDTPTMDTVYFYKFNNYYNRIIKKYDAVADYGTPMLTQTNCNFVHGDGVNSEFTINKGSVLVDTPDYCVVKDYNGALSRWFVTNSFKTRRGQDKLTLRRDLIADFYDDVLRYSPCLIRKGYVGNNSPFVFNDEGVKYNKIKESEILIKDKSNCSYIIGFIANNTPAIGTINGTIKGTDYDYVYDSMADFPMKNYTDGAGNTHTDTKKRIYGNSPTTRIYYSLKYSGLSFHTSGGSTLTENYETIMRQTGLGKPSYYTPIYPTNYSTGLYYESGSGLTLNNLRIISRSLTGTSAGAELLYLKTYYSNWLYNKMIFSQLQAHAEKVLGVSSDLADLTQYAGKKIKIGANIYDASIKVVSSSSSVINYNSYNPTIRDAFYNMVATINNNKPTAGQMSSSTMDVHYGSSYSNFYENDLKVMGETENIILELSPSEINIHTSLLAANSRAHLEEQPYDMFMLINDNNKAYKVGTTDYTSNHKVNINIAQAICQASGSAAYDIQIVPFNPLPGSILDDGSLQFLNFDTHEIYNSDNDVIGHYIMCSSADLKFNLEKDELKFIPTDYKKDYNLKQYRLCSPNQETIFEFSPAMNGGITSWEITTNYRPFASYIKIQPSWNYLYGEELYNDLTDFRGLVYNSSLCITQLSDAYSNYVSNNKNFQQLFDNQINTLTKTQDIQMSALEDTLGLRSFTGMPISSVLKVIGGSKDIDMQRELNNVALSKMRTDFNFQMDNIKSMPHTIKKLTAINGDTRIFPFIEVYTAHPDEEESFDWKMKYTGMTIMTTGKIWDYLKLNEETFIQADLIRLDLSRSEETADNHIAVEIAAELEKGIYLTKESE